jgi:hypothetical protein
MASLDNAELAIVDAIKCARLRRRARHGGALVAPMVTSAASMSPQGMSNVHEQLRARARRHGIRSSRVAISTRRLL